MDPDIRFGSAWEMLIADGGAAAAASLLKADLQIKLYQPRSAS
jgi:hypothetical protein